MEHEEIANLVKKWQETKDDDAVSLLYNNMRPILLNMSNNRFRNLSYRHLDIESLIDEVFFKSLISYNGSVKFLTYVMGNLKNTLIMQNKGKKYKLIDNPLDPKFEKPSSKSMPAKDDIDFRVMSKFLDVLTTREIQLVFMRFYEDKTTRILADIFGVSFQGISQMLQKALLKMKGAECESFVNGSLIDK